MRFSKAWLAGIVVASVVVPLAASALTPEVQAQIAVLLQRVQQLQALLDQLRAGQSVQYPTTTSCVDLTYNMGPDDTDSNTGGDVTKLQRFLAGQPGIYPEGRVTGFYGPATTRAVQRWQSAHGIVSSGTPDTTGYGYVGPRTRGAMSCNGTTYFQSTYYNQGTYYTQSSYSPSSCTLDGTTLASGQSRTFYSAQNSTTCAANMKVRTCTNGTFSESSSYSYASCSPPIPGPVSASARCVTHNYCSNGSLYYQNDSDCAETLVQTSALQCTEGSIKGSRCVSHYYCSAGNLYFQNDADCAVTLNQANSTQCGATAATNFTATPTNGAAPVSVKFTATLPAAQPASDYSVDFGDGTNSVMSREMVVGSCASGSCATATDLIYVSHTYTSAGTYAAKLKKGSTQIATQTVTVTGVVGVGSRINASTAPSGISQITLTVSPIEMPYCISSGDNGIIDWGDGSAMVNQPGVLIGYLWGIPCNGPLVYTHTYASPGYYTINITLNGYSQTLSIYGGYWLPL